MAIAKKYQFDLVAHIASDHLSSVAVFDAPAVLELGLRYRELEVVKSAMVFFHSAKISSLDRDLLESLPAKVVVVRLFILQEKVTAGDLYWMQAARDFVSQTLVLSPRTARSVLKLSVRVQNFD